MKVIRRLEHTPSVIFMSCNFLSCNFMSCKLVRHFHIRLFRAMRISLSISCPAISCPAVLMSIIFTSSIFSQPWLLLVIWLLSVCVSVWYMCRCPCDECNISHIITCGLISPDVNDHHHHQHHGSESHPPLDQDSNDVMRCHDDTSSLSPSRLSHRRDLERYYANIKPPSVPSSASSSCSESPIILDRCRFFGENFECVTLRLFVIHDITVC